MFLHKHLSANSIKLNEFPFIRELAMEAYLIENDAVLALHPEHLFEVRILESEFSLKAGRETKKTDGRIDVLARYDPAEYLAIIELKAGQLQRKHVEQLEDYLERTEEILSEYPDIWEPTDSPVPKWLGVMVGTAIEPRLAMDISDGLTTSNSIPIAALTLRRFRGDDGQIYVITDTYVGKSLTGKDYTKYLFNGKQYSKSRLVLAIVQSYVESHPQVSYAELKEVFPNDLQKPGSYGVFTSIDKAERVFEETGYYRYYIKPEDLVKVRDETIAVCSQWGIKNIGNILDKAKELDLRVKIAR